MFRFNIVDELSIYDMDFISIRRYIESVMSTLTRMEGCQPTVVDGYEHYKTHPEHTVPKVIDFPR